MDIYNLPFERSASSGSNGPEKTNDAEKTEGDSRPKGLKRNPTLKNLTLGLLSNGRHSFSNIVHPVAIAVDSEGTQQKFDKVFRLARGITGKPPATPALIADWQFS